MAKNHTDDPKADAGTRRASGAGADRANGSHHTSGDDSPGDQSLQARALDALRTAPDALRQTATAVADRAPDVVRQTANVVAEHAPDAVAASQTAITEATNRIQRGSEEQLAGWASFAIGLWLGLTLGRAPRLLSTVAGLPALILAGALVGRRGGVRLKVSK